MPIVGPDMRTSQIVNHPSRLAIEQAVIAGVPIVRIADEFRVSASSIYRHQQRHLGPVLREAMRTIERGSTASLVERIADIAADALTARRAALEAGQTTAAVKAGDHELRALTTLLDRLGIDSTDTLDQLRDGEILARAVGSVSRSHPRVAEALALTLTEMGADEMAESLRAISRNTTREAVAS